MIIDDGYFLSKENPAATVDQRSLELLALKLKEAPAYIEARNQAAKNWRAVSGSDPSEQDWEMFESVIDEYAFNYALRAVNCDSNYPKVLATAFGPAHKWFGQEFPGSRMGGDGPDNHYAFIPIDDQATFKINGCQFDPSPANVVWQFSEDVLFTISPKTLYASDFEYNQDGSFEVTLGPEKENGRKNYVQIPKGVNFLFIRECRSDWRQIPSAIRVERLDPPTDDPWSFDQMLEKARYFILTGVPRAYWFVRIARALETNAMTEPFITGSIGGLHLQKISLGNLHLEKDMAFVVTVGSGNADFRDFVLQDIWYRTVDYPNRLTSMNNSQSEFNPDGITTSYVISHQDPGIHNWLDASGIENLSPVHRWQGLPLHEQEDNAPFIDGRLVKLDEIETYLPDTIKRITPEEREQQMAERKANYMLRWVDS